MIIVIIMFVDRVEELKSLQKKLKSDKFELIIVYGRRRIGKTRLILEAIKNIEHVYYLAVEGNNLKYFKEAASNIAPEIRYVQEDWEIYFRFLKDKVIVIDEFPNLIKENRHIVSILQRIVDNQLKNTKTKIILCGSSISMMSEKVLSYRSPLYGRRTASLKLQPLKFKDIKGFFPNVGIKDLIEIYGFAGGIPYYLEKIEMPFWKWLRNELESPDSFLKDEMDFVIKYEFEDVSTYKKILEAIAMGNTTPKEIKDYLGMKHSDITPYLRNLMLTEFIKREVPITENWRSKKGRYFIKDNFTAFWFRYIFPNLSAIEEGIFDVDRIRKDYSLYLGRIFENVVKEVLIIQSKSNTLPFKITKIGKWWHKDKEIDLVALNENSGDIMFVEVKWKDNVNAEKILHKLKEKAKYVRWKNDYRKEHFAIFAKSFRKKINEYCFDLKDLERMINKV